MKLLGLGRFGRIRPPDPEGQRLADDRPVTRLIETTTGRAIFNMMLPEILRFFDPGMPLAKGDVKVLVLDAFERLGSERTADLVDRMKEIGFRYATRSGVSISVDDIVVPERKTEIIAEARE